MSEKQLADIVYQNTNDITALTRKVNEIDTDLKIVMRDQSKLGQLIEAQIKTNFEISNIKDDLKSTNANIATITTTLKSIETNLLQKDAAETAKSTFRADLKKYLPALIILCAAMFIFGLILDDMNIIKLIFGK